MSWTIGVLCFPSFGGSGIVASGLALGLAQRGHRVHVLATAPPSRTLPPCDRLTFHPVPVANYPLFEHAPYALAATSAIVEVARSHRLDVLHVHYAVPHAASAYLARQMLGTAAPKVITSLHGTDVTVLGADPCYASVTRFAVAASDGIVVPSRALAAAAQAFLEPAAPHLEIIPNFVDSARFAPVSAPDPRHFDALFGSPTRGPVLFHVSNFRAVKRTCDLMEVLARVRKVLPEARMVLVGDGPERAATEAHARALGVDMAAAFIGKRDDFVGLLQHADAFVLPSQGESFGVAALEALSTGVPVFGYRVGGLPELVTDEVGRLVAPQDVDALAAALVSVLREPAGQRAMAAAARPHVLAHYRVEPALDRYEAYFHRVLAGGERR